MKQDFSRRPLYCYFIEVTQMKRIRINLCLLLHLRMYMYKFSALIHDTRTYMKVTVSIN